MQTLVRYDLVMSQPTKEMPFCTVLLYERPRVGEVIAVRQAAPTSPHSGGLAGGNAAQTVFVKVLQLVHHGVRDGDRLAPRSGAPTTVYVGLLDDAGQEIPVERGVIPGLPRPVAEPEPEPPAEQPQVVTMVVGEDGGPTRRP